MPNMKQQHTLKPLLKTGDEVTAAWWPASTPDISEVAPSGWYRGVISSYKTLHPTNNTSSNNCYGPVRFYCVNFDDGDVGSDIPEHFVFLQDEYEIMTMKDDDDDDEDIVWKGVRTVTDRHTDDPWAKHVGWYVATIDGEDHTFSLLSDALRAYDSFVVSTKGFKTKKEHLNLPGDVSNYILYLSSVFLNCAFNGSSPLLSLVVGQIIQGQRKGGETQIGDRGA